MPSRKIREPFIQKEPTDQDQYELYGMSVSGKELESMQKKSLDYISNSTWEKMNNPVNILSNTNRMSGSNVNTANLIYEAKLLNYVINSGANMDIDTITALTSLKMQIAMKKSAVEMDMAIGMGSEDVGQGIGAFFELEQLMELEQNVTQMISDEFSDKTRDKIRSGVTKKKKKKRHGA
jgi:hypothetical protein